MAVTETKPAPSASERVDLARLMLCCGVLAPPVVIVFTLVAAAITPGYSSITETVSELASVGTPHPAVLIAGFVIYGLLINVFACGFYRFFCGRTARQIWLALAVYGIGIMLTGLVRYHPQSSFDYDVTLINALHGFFAVISYIAPLVAMALFAGYARRQTAWRVFTRPTIVGIILAVGLSVLFLPESLTPIEGLLQRIVYLLPMLWVMAVAIRALRFPLAASRFN